MLNISVPIPKTPLHYYELLRNNNKSSTCSCSSKSVTGPDIRKNHYFLFQKKIVQILTNAHYIMKIKVLFIHPVRSEFKYLDAVWLTVYIRGRQLMLINVIHAISGQKKIAMINDAIKVMMP